MVSRSRRIDSGTLSKDGCAAVIILTRVGGSPFAVNPDLIERADETPDTVITLVDGTKYIVVEGIEILIDRILDYRARIIARSAGFDRESVDELSLLDAGRPHSGSREGGPDAAVIPLHRREG